MAPNPATSILLTLLPNGVADAANARVSVLVTPSLADGTEIVGTPFEDWPSTAAKLLSGLNKINCGVAGSARPVSARPDSDQRTQFDTTMWTMLMAGNRATTRARNSSDVATNSLKKWRISHDAAALHYAHQRHRQDRVNAELLSRVNEKIRTDSDYKDFLNRLNAQHRVINLYLHPFRQLNTTDPGNPQGAPIDRLLARRQEAAHFCASEATNPSYSPDFRALLNARVTHALELLEQGDEQLLDIGIYAVELSCAASLSYNYPADSNAAVKSVIAKAKQPSKPDAHDGILASALDQAQRYAEFLLFSRRSRGMEKKLDHDPLPAPDFHQLLGLVHRSPSLLRPLGLVFDLVFPVPPDTKVISLVEPVIPDVPQCKVLFTQCTVVTDTSLARSLKEFYATPATSDVPLIYKRFLDLTAQDSSGAPMFSLISQDSEGDTHKRVQSSIADSYAVEYLSKANSHPATGQAETPASVSLNKLPSVRTAGITLLHSQRADRLEAALKRAAAADLGLLSNPFFADDLVLGYRFDVRCGDMSTHWYPLGKRSSRYFMLDGNGQETDKVFVPRTDREKCIDEGFVSPATTSTDPQNGESQIQVYQALFTWSGWGIGIPSLFEAMNQQKGGDPPTGANQHLRVKPYYEHDGKLLPLRFGRTYELRSRIVDLAGNSVQPVDKDVSDDSSVVLPVVMQRHEAIRSPQVLLTEALHSDADPGAQSDRLVVRDSSGDTTRAVVPPRETLHLAELHGILRDSNVPPSAFPGVELDDDGSFPQGAPDAISGHGRSAIFTADEAADAPTLPYYPDPLATFLKVNLLSYSVPGNISLDPLRDQIKTPLPFYPVTQKGAWPFCSPCRIRLIAGDPGTKITAEARSVPKDDNGNPSDLVQGLLITLPPAAFVTLNLSSASVTLDPNLPHSANQQRTAESAPALGGGKSLVMAMQVPPPDAIPAATQFPHLVATLATGRDSRTFELVPNPRQAAAPVGPGVVQALRAAAQKLAIEGVDPNQFLLNGDIPSLTPPHPITLVHAVQTPLLDAAPATGFEMRRALGQSEAQLYAELGPDDIWHSASKIVCHATWTDKIDDLKKSETGTTDRTSSELVFELSEAQNALLKQTKGSTNPQNTLFHHLRDTRAHLITYQLSATSCFRDYYSEDSPESDFIRTSPALTERWVRSSARPPAPAVCYLIPAFEWRENNDPDCRGWIRQRLHLIRVYHERPFGVSGDLEQLGVLLAPKVNAGSDTWIGKDYVSQVAMDPIHRVGVAQAIPKQMTTDQLTGYTFAPSCQLAEVEDPVSVDVAAYDMKWAEKRQLWYCDIPTNFCKQYAPFVQLALVRYQAQALGSVNGEPEARISPVVFAEFSQIAPNRFASVQVKGKGVTLTVSGDSYGSRLGQPPKYPDTSFDNKISLTLQNRWHHLPPDMAWKPCACTIPPPDFKLIDGICTWTFHFTLPHHPSWFKYRLQIEESEVMYQDDPSTRTPTATPRTAASMLATLPVEATRTTYFDFLEL